MSAKTRVLIVDDSSVVRRLLTRVVEGEPDMEVAGTASNGRIGIRMAGELRPDIMLLDMELGDVSGLDVLGAVHAAQPKLPILMFSAHTAKGAVATISALMAGATDCILKPSASDTGSDPVTATRDLVVPRIRQFAPRLAVTASVVQRRPAAMGPRTVVRAAPRRARQQAVQILAIASSTGGPEALDVVFGALPKLSVPIVVVQHMPPEFTRLLAQRLSSRSAVEVVEGASGMALKPGYAYIAPGGKHMALTRSGTTMAITLNDDPPENSCRPAADVLFRSVATHYGGSTLAVVLTGMGGDGKRGCELIRTAGGTIFAQDEATSCVWGMPRAVAEAGLADAILPLDQVAGSIVEQVDQTHYMSARGA
jgi:two-component system chemotaxis response regulator CheB